MQVIEISGDEDFGYKKAFTEGDSQEAENKSFQDRRTKDIDCL